MKTIPALMIEPPRLAELRVNGVPIETSGQSVLVEFVLRTDCEATPRISMALAGSPDSRDIDLQCAQSYVRFELSPDSMKGEKQTISVALITPTMPDVLEVEFINQQSAMLATGLEPLGYGLSWLAGCGFTVEFRAPIPTRTPDQDSLLELYSGRLGPDLYTALTDCRWIVRDRAENTESVLDGGRPIDW